MSHLRTPVHPTDTPEDCDRQRSIRLASLLGSPVHSRCELADVLDDFRRYQVQHRDFLTAYGLPPVPFRRSSWLYRQLGWLYVTRQTSSPIPAAEISEQAPNSTVAPYRWLAIRKQNDWDEVGEHVVVGYEQADLINGLEWLDAPRIEAGRPRLHELKLGLLGLAVEALRVESDARFRRRCFDLLETSLTKDDADFYFRLDRYYRGTDATGNQVTVPPDPPPGGVSDLIEFVGHVDLELRQGLMSAVRARLPVTLFDEAVLRTRERPLTPHEVAGIDACWHELTSRLADAERFWDEFRTAVRERIRKRFRVTVPVFIHPALLDTAHRLLPLYTTHLEASDEQGLPAERPFVPTELPIWNAQTRELWYLQCCVRQYRRYTKSQAGSTRRLDQIELVLGAFQESGWKSRIDDPLPPTKGVNVVERRHNLIKTLNKKQRQDGPKGTIHFGVDGTGFKWSYC